MEEKRNLLTNSCSFTGVKPIMIEWPYPSCLPSLSISIMKTAYPAQRVLWQRRFWGLQWRKPARRKSRRFRLEGFPSLIKEQLLTLVWRRRYKQHTQRTRPAVA